jgi:hypothetical protein
MSLTNVVEWLSWTSRGERPAWLSSFDAYLHHASERLAEVLASQRAAAPSMVADIQRLLAAASDGVYVRFVTAPEVTNRLFWGRPSTETLAFFVAALETELAAAGLMPATERTGWSALGDVFVASDGRVERPFTIDGLMPLDIGSPHAETMAQSEGFVDAGTPETRSFDAEELARLRLSLASTSRAIHAVNPEVSAFVETFNRVVILQKDPGAPDLFASGSTGQYIGRAFLANPHLPALGEAQLADAIVHEAIHGLLYMEEALQPWVLDPALYNFEPVLTSPWTGNRLAVRPFLQACFVWYGLTHFFADAMQTSQFPDARARNRLRVATTGFLEQRFEVILRDYTDRLAPELVTAISTMQERIVDAFRTAAA